MEATITPCANGPLLVRGPVKLLDADGNAVPLRRETIALCRCGRSRTRPFCDGTHKLIDFKAEGGIAASPHPASVDPDGER